MNEYLSIAILLVVGALSGICASLGMGGGFVLLIYLTAVIAMPQREAQLINLLFFLPIAALSLYFHFKNKLIHAPVILPAIAGGILGVLLGFFVSTFLSNEGIRKVFAVFILLVGLNLLKDSINVRNKKA